MNIEGVKNVGIWLRVSTDMQADTDALKHHEIRARAYAESKGWKVVEVYNLSGVSGKTVMDHPETKRMIRDVQSGSISALIFSKLARLARNTRELLDIADIFQANEAGLVSLQESIDTTTAGGRLFFTMLAATTQFERDEIASRVAASVPVRASLGKPLGGQSSFGYMWEDKKLVINPQEAPIRKLIYELFDQHKRKKKVATILNDKGYRTRKGAKFSTTTVDRLLRDTTAKGLHRQNYTKSTGTNSKWIVKDQKEWVYNEVEAIVSEELWNSCNRYLDNQRAKLSAARGRTPKHLFSGLLECECGKKMYPYNSASTYRCKGCNNKIPMAVIEEVFESELTTFLTSQDDVKEFLSKSHQYVEEKTQQQNTLLSEKNTTENQMDKIYKLYLEDGVSVDGFRAKNQPLEDRLKQINQTLEELKTDIDFMKFEKISADKINENGKSIADAYSKLSKDEKRNLIESITNKIIIGKNTIDISFTYAPFLNLGKKYTQPQTFMLANNWKSQR